MARTMPGALQWYSFWGTWPSSSTALWVRQQQIITQWARPECSRQRGSFTYLLTNLTGLKEKTGNISLWSFIQFSSETKITNKVFLASKWAPFQRLWNRICLLMKFLGPSFLAFWSGNRYVIISKFITIKLKKHNQKCAKINQKNMGIYAYPEMSIK